MTALMDNPPETNEILADTTWETELTDLLSMLSSTQTELLSLLSEKRKMLLDPNPEGLAEIEPREQQLIAKLHLCQDRRAELLQKAGDEGLPSESILQLSSALEQDGNDKLGGKLHEAKLRSRLLQHHSLTNWVLVQRTIIHLSQMLEIIATGGRLQPTYEKGEKSVSSGSLIDHAA